MSAVIGTLNCLLQAEQTPIAGVLESYLVTLRTRFAIQPFDWRIAGARTIESICRSSRDLLEEECLSLHVPTYGRILDEFASRTVAALQSCFTFRMMRSFRTQSHCELNGQSRHLRLRGTSLIFRRKSWRKKD